MAARPVGIVSPAPFVVVRLHSEVPVAAFIASIREAMLATPSVPSVTTYRVPPLLTARAPMPSSWLFPRERDQSTLPGVVASKAVTCAILPFSVDDHQRTNIRLLASKTSFPGL